MCTSAPPPGTDGIGICWSDEDLCKLLDRMIHGYPPPRKVLADLNPYHYMPSNLPEDFWYFLRSDGKKDTETGFWKAKGEACHIFTNSDITGWRTTFEFYEGQEPHGRKTDWVMQEYRITQKGMHENIRPKDSSSLCRVFPISGQSSINKTQDNLTGADVAGGNYIPSMRSVIPSEENNNTGQGSTRKSQVNSGDDETKPLPVTERHLNHPVENLHQTDWVSTGDYLELLDLLNPGLSSSSSENSSFRSMSSDECFDSLALLRDLEAEDKKNMQRKNLDCEFSVSASVRPNEVVMCPATAESLTSGNGNKSQPEAPNTNRSVRALAIEEKPSDERVFNPAIRTREADGNSEGPSNSRNVASSSSVRKPTPDREKETGFGRPRKLRKKYLCFMPF